MECTKCKQEFDEYELRRLIVLRSRNLRNLLPVSYQYGLYCKGCFKFYYDLNIKLNKARKKQKYNIGV